MWGGFEVVDVDDFLDDVGECGFDFGEGVQMSNFDLRILGGFDCSIDIFGDVFYLLFQFFFDEDGEFVFDIEMKFQQVWMFDIVEFYFL